MNDPRPLAYTTSTGDEPVNKAAANTDAAEPALQPVKKIAKKATKKHAFSRTKAASVQLKHVKVDPRVMRAAKRAILPGQRLVIVDAETVRLVNEGGVS